MSCQGNDCVKGALKLLKAIAGVGEAPWQAVQARQRACAECPHLKPGPAWPLRRCGICDCFIAAKTRLASEACPDQPPRWDKV